MLLIINLLRNDSSHETAVDYKKALWNQGKKYVYKIWENSKACLQMPLMIDRLLGAVLFYPK